MTHDTRATPLLEELCALAPRLLRVHRIPVPRRAAMGTARALVLSLDRGALRIARDAAGSPTIAPIADADADADELAAGILANEEDPWWSVLGAPIAAVWQVTGPRGGIALQLRDDASNPKIVTAAAVDDTSEALRIFAEPKPRWRERLG